MPGSPGLLLLVILKRASPKYNMYTYMYIITIIRRVLVYEVMQDFYDQPIPTTIPKLHAFGM